MKTYKVTCYQGAVGDFATEWWTEEDWIKHNQYVEELKRTGEYLKPFEVELSLMPNPLYDDSALSTQPIISHSLEIFDFGKSKD